MSQALRVLRGAHLKYARVVEQAGDRKIERDDLRGRASHARNIRQVAHDRHGVLSPLLDGLLHLGELSAVAADQEKRRTWPARVPCCDQCRMSVR
jgi:hypothetical protein